MYNQKKWFVLFAALILGIAARMFAPESFVRTANAETKLTEIEADAKETIADAKETEEVTETEDVNVVFDLISAEDIWKQTFREFKYGEMTGEKLAAIALSEVRNRDLALMSSSTDHIVNYHDRRFAITEDDYQVLLKIVQAEASTEDIKGRMLVANVVLNRLEVGFGGDTITEVVFAKGQFAPVTNGRIFKVTPDKTTIEAVERVLNGEDYSKGALYFMARNLASKSGVRWFDKNLKLLFKHGCHEFYIEK